MVLTGPTLLSICAQRLLAYGRDPADTAHVVYMHLVDRLEEASTVDNGREARRIIPQQH